MEQLRKYPRTQHIEGSALQADDDPNAIPFRHLAGRWLVVEEKMDGANCGIRFAADGQLQLQSRGHYLTGGPRERQFTLLKSWAQRYATELWDLLGSRYILYGEWLYGCHTIFYTDLPHYLLEFDLYDCDTDQFLSTDRRHALLQAAPFIASVTVLHAGPLTTLTELKALVGPSGFVSTDQAEQLRSAAIELGLDPQVTAKTADLSGLMEGLYVKIEEHGQVVGRYKFVRTGFLQTVLDSGSHWLDRPLLPNRLRTDVSLW
jgi:hypothetical protein